MYIKTANIFGFGRFIDTKFNFNSDYQVIRGLNESGKTTLLAFIKSILFGFADGKRKYEQYLPKNSSQYGGELLIIDDSKEWLIRRIKGKNGGDLTIYQNDKEQPVSSIDYLLKNIDKNMYENIYVLNQNNIGNVLSLKRQDLITEVLTVGAIGSSNWIELMNSIEKDADSIYKTGSRAKKPLNIALSEYDRLIDKKSLYKSQNDDFQILNNKIKDISSKIDEEIKYKDTLINKLRLQEKIFEKKDLYIEFLGFSKVISNNPIQNDDWDKFNFNEQQLINIKNNIDELNNSSVKLTDEEISILNKYEKNSKEISRLENDINAIVHNQYQLELLNDEKSKYQSSKDNLLGSNKLLNSNMTPLTSEEISNLSVKDSNINYYKIASAVFFMLLAVFIPGIVKIIFVIIGIISLLLVVKPANKKNRNQDYYFGNHNYQNLTLDEALSLQDKISKLNELENSINRHDVKIKEINSVLNKWKSEIKSLNIIDNYSVKSFNEYLEDINYLKKKKFDIDKSKESTLQKISQLNSNLDIITKNQQGIFAKYHVLNRDELIAKRDKEALVQEEIKRREVIKESLDKNILNNANENSNYFKNISNEITSLKDKLSEVNSKINDLNELLVRTQLEISNLSSDKDYLELEQKTNDKKSEIIDLYDEWISNKLGARWIYDTLNLASSNRFPNMLERSKKYFSILTNNNYVDIEFGEKIIKTQRKDFQKFELPELSKGTISQLYIALRCAFVMEISDIVSLPILIDDTFNDFDKTRYDLSVHLLKEMGKENQIFYVTTNNISIDNFEKDHIINLKGE